MSLLLLLLVFAFAVVVCRRQQEKMSDEEDPKAHVRVCVWDAKFDTTAGIIVIYMQIPFDHTLGAWIVVNIDKYCFGFIITKKIFLYGLG